MSRWISLETLWQDVRYALRMMRRSPGFTAVAVLSLSLGIGANTAIFSLINILMLRLLPVKDPQQLVELLSRYPGEPRINAFSWQSYEHYRDHNHVFSGLIGTSGPTRLNVRSEGLEPETLTGEHCGRELLPRAWHDARYWPADWSGRQLHGNSSGRGSRSELVVLEEPVQSGSHHSGQADYCGKCAGDDCRGNAACVLWTAGRVQDGHLVTAPNF